jgi:hypothetical protein
MTKSKLLGATAILIAAIATPAIAQQARQEPGAYAQHHPWVNNYYYGYGRPAFWPGYVAADVVGAAIGTADAIVTAPFRDRDSYAYYGGPAPYDDSYAYSGNRPARTTCGLQPGATYLGPDGRWYPC